MDNFPEDIVDVPISTGLYRLPDDIKDEIVKAVNLWRNASLIQNPLLVERALSALQKPYSSTTAPPSPEDVQVQLREGHAPNKLRNRINGFRSYLEAMIDQAQGEYKISLEKVKSALDSATDGA